MALRWPAKAIGPQTNKVMSAICAAAMIEPQRAAIPKAIARPVAR
jgi:hypothetical protein